MRLLLDKLSELLVGSFPICGGEVKVLFHFDSVPTIRKKLGDLCVLGLRRGEGVAAEVLFEGPLSKSSPAREEIQPTILQL